MTSSSRTSEMLGRLLVAAGAILLALYAIPTVYGNVMARIAVAQFRHGSAAHSLWDAGRIHAYQRSLAVSFAPPEAVVRVPKVGIEVPLLEGTSDLAMNRGVGHVTGTALPGQPGNLAISGHRDGFFRPLKDVVPGDLIEIDRPAHPGEPAHSGQHTDRYLVRNTRIVFPSDTSVLQNTPDATLTLITCYPFYYVGPAPQRYIVQASLLPPSQALSQVKPQAPSQVKPQVKYQAPSQAKSQANPQAPSQATPTSIPAVSGD